MPGWSAKDSTRREFTGSASATRVAPAGNASAQQLARRALATINSDLAAAEDEMVAVCFRHMSGSDGTETLAKAVRPIVQGHPNLKFWFVGDGPQRESLYEFLRSEGVRTSISMPGSFSDIEDVLIAADLIVQTDERGLDFTVPSAIAAELPLGDAKQRRDPASDQRCCPADRRRAW